MKSNKAMEHVLDGLKPRLRGSSASLGLVYGYPVLQALFNFPIPSLPTPSYCCHPPSLAGDKMYVRNIQGYAYDSADTRISQRGMAVASHFGQRTHSMLSRRWQDKGPIHPWSKDMKYPSVQMYFLEITCPLLTKAAVPKEIMNFPGGLVLGIGVGGRSPAVSGSCTIHKMELKTPVMSAPLPQVLPCTRECHIKWKKKDITTSQNKLRKNFVF